MMPGRAKRQHDRPDGAEETLAADPGGFLELLVDLQERGGQRLHGVGHEARDEGEREDPDRAVKPARQSDPGPQIGDADHQARDRHRQRRDQVDAAPPGRVAAVDRVADREGEHAAEHRRDQADLHGVPDRPHGQRVVEDAVEMHQRVMPHVEQAGGARDEQEARGTRPRSAPESAARRRRKDRPARAPSVSQRQRPRSRLRGRNALPATVVKLLPRQHAIAAAPPARR